MRTLSHADLATRRPVWLAISELFLDTNLEAVDIRRIATELARSPYSLEDLDNILLHEVYPACHWNLVSIAGEWSAFDPDWLESRILRGPSGFATMWAHSVGRVGRFSSIAWRRIKRHVLEERTVT